MSFSAVFLIALFLNWYYYTRHEYVNRVMPEDLPNQVDVEH